MSSESRVEALSSALAPLLSVPFSSWIVLALLGTSAAFVTWVVWSLARWVRNWQGAVLATFEDFTVAESSDEYIVVHADDVPKHFKTGTDVTVSVIANGKTRRATGTIRRKTKNFSARSIEIPRSLYPALFDATDQVEVVSPQKLKIDQGHRFFLERWINHPDDEVRLQIRFGIIMTVVSLFVGFLQGYIFEFVWTNDAASTEPHSVLDCRAPLPEAGKQFEGKVSYVGDGDGLCVGFERGGVLVRLKDFRAPELNQKGGSAARNALRNIALNQFVTCTSYGVEGYHRVTAVCRIGDVSVGDLMRRAGIQEGGR